MGGPSANTLDYERTSLRPPWWKRRPSRSVWASALIMGLLLAALLFLVLPARNGREPSPRLMCASNLRQIGLGIQFYANDNNDRLPPDLAAVLLMQDLESRVFVCPSSGDVPASGPTTQSAAQQLATPGFCSYVLAARLPATSRALTPAHVVAYESPANHNGRGMNVLFGDFHVEWVDKQQAAHLAAELKAGFNPPRRARTGDQP